MLIHFDAKKTNRMKIKISSLFILLITGALFLTGCAGSAGQRSATGWPGLSADDTTAYLADNRFVYAVNLSNGLEKWRFPVTSDNKRSFYATPTLTSDGQLIAGSYENVLFSLDPNTGVEKWQFTDADNRYIAAPLVIETGIFAPNANNNLYALDLQGNLLWTFTTSGPLWATPTSDPDCKCIYLPGMDHLLYSIDAQTGELNWQTSELGGSLVGTPAFGSGVLYFGTFNNELLALNANNGQVIWKVPTQDWVWGGPILLDNVLYFGDLSGAFYALNIEDGSVKWQQQADGAITQSPLLSDEKIYFTTAAGSVYALDLNGTTLWTKNLGEKVKLFTTPVRAGDLILVAQTGADGLLVAFDAQGTQKWIFTPEVKK
jgi:outer membrane protein assembly factor BamB